MIAVRVAKSMPKTIAKAIGVAAAKAKPTALAINS